MRNRKKYAPEFKGKVALAAYKGSKTMAEICRDYEIHESMIQKWKSQLTQNISVVFGATQKSNNNEQEMVQLHAKIGELLIERDFLKKALKM